MSSSLASSARISGGSKLAYPSPFFDIASTYLPRNMREMFHYCEYYYRIHPVIHQAITKMAEYPVTDLIVEDEDPNIIKIWEELFNDQLDYKSFLVNSRLDLNCFGNAYITPFFPFTKTLTCKKCKKSFSAESILSHWTYSAYRFRLHCPSCGDRSDADVEDKYYVNPSRLKLIRWNVHNIVANGSEFGSYHYFYKTPNVARNEWALGQKHKIAGTPQQFLDAAQKNKLIVLNNQNFYHMKRPSISGQDPTYGMPLMMPVLKDAFLFQIFKKSVEQILLEHAVPFRLLFPQAASASADVIATVPLAQWKRQVESAIQHWKRDNNSLGVLPYPIGKETIGGEAKVFLIGQEMQQQMEILITGMGIPREFIIGGLSWSGSNVSLKMLENTFINDRLAMRRLTKFLMRRISPYIGVRPPKDISFKKFKMADDLQRKMLSFQFNQANKLSDTTLLDECDYDSEKEDALMKKESKRRRDTVKEQMIANAEIQAEAQAVMQKHGIKTQADLQKYQLSLQKELESSGVPPGADLLGMANDIAGKVTQMDPAQAQQYMQQLNASQPQMGGVVQDMIKNMQNTGQGGSFMKPEPEQKPPRRLAQ